MRLRRASLALLMAVGLSLSGLVSVAAASPSGVSAATPPELTAICEDLFAGVYETPSSEPLAVCQWDMALIDATWVPWPYRSRIAALSVQLVATSTGAAVGVPGLMNEQERARSRLGAMSGWVGSTPLSRMPMVTPSPVALDQA